MKRRGSGAGVPEKVLTQLLYIGIFERRSKTTSTFYKRSSEPVLVNGFEALRGKVSDRLRSVAKKFAKVEVQHPGILLKIRARCNSNNKVLFGGPPLRFRAMDFALLRL